MKKADFQQSNTSLTKFIEENSKKIKEITPINPSISAQDEWRQEDFWDKFSKEENN